MLANIMLLTKKDVFIFIDFSNVDTNEIKVLL